MTRVQGVNTKEGEGTEAKAGGLGVAVWREEAGVGMAGPGRNLGP